MALDTWGVLLTRGQPFHRGHIEVIRKAAEENDYVLVVIGSANKSYTERNPLHINVRESLFERLREYLHNEYGIEPYRIKYLSLRDLSKDSSIPYESSNGSSNTSFNSVNSEWGSYLYYNIIAKTGTKTFTLYYNDSSEIVSAWFSEELWKRITVKSAFRIEKYSSSAVREACKSYNTDYLNDALCYLSMQEIKNISMLCRNV